MLTLKFCGIRPHEWSQWICSCPAETGLHCSHYGCCLQFYKIASYFLKGSKKGAFPACRKQGNTSDWLIWPSNTSQCLQWMNTLDQTLANLVGFPFLSSWPENGAVRGPLSWHKINSGAPTDPLKTPCIPPSHPKLAALLCPSPGPPWCSREVASPAIN